jgi:hypothetical protein
MEEAIDTIVKRLLAAKEREARRGGYIADTIELIRQTPHVNDPGYEVANRLADALVEICGLK